jgi:signal transduction histidine kinase
VLGRGRLSTRVTLAFAFGGFAVVAVLATVTYFLSQRYLLDQRERAGTRQAFLDARFMRERLEDPNEDPHGVLGLLLLPQGSDAALESSDGQWTSTAESLQPQDIPPGLRRLVDAGDAAHQRIDLRGEPRLVVGAPVLLPDGSYSYFEVLSLHELESTLQVVRDSLLAAAVVATLAAALLGRWASRRALRPLVNVSAAAGRIADGDFTARLDHQADPDLDRVAGSFNSMANALETRIERDERFVSDVTHELRSPLTTLSASADVLRARSKDLPAPARTAMELVVAEIARLRNMVEELLELSRAEVGADPLRLEPVRLGELAVQSAARSADGAFTVQLAPELDDQPVLVDKRRFERILANLLDNAERHGKGAVALRAYRRDGYVRLEVDDAGPGVPAEDRALIFERFARGTKSGSRGAEGGTGLGLALVAEHARVHGGSVWVEEGPDGHGARFVVELPWRPA